MESNAIAALVPPVMPQNGVVAAELPGVPGGDTISSLFSRMLNLTTEASLPVLTPVTDIQQSAPATVVALPVAEFPIPGDTTNLATPITGGDIPSLMVPDRVDTITMLAFQAVPAPLPENGESLQNVGEAAAAETVLKPVQNDAGARMAPEETTVTTADRDPSATMEPSRETSEFLLAAAQQFLSQPVTTGRPLQKWADVPESAEPAAAITPLKAVRTADMVTLGATPVTGVQDSPDTVPAAVAQPAGRMNPEASRAVPTPLVTEIAPLIGAEPAVSRPVAAVTAAEITQVHSAPVSPAAPEGSDREPLPQFAAVRSELAAQVGGKPARLQARGGHDPVTARGAETPAPVTNSQTFNRPLLEVVVEDIAVDQSFESAADPAKADLSTDVAAAAKSQQTLIGGAGVMKSEPAVLPAAGEAAKSVSHEQILAQVKEQLGKAEFRVDDGRVVLRLHPEELGSLRIDVKLDDQRLRLHIVAENPAVREALAANMDSLKETLSRQQIVMERFEVTSGQGQDQQQLFKEHRQQVLDGQGNRPGRIVTERAEDGDVVDRRAMNAYWAPQESGLLDVRF